MKFEVLDSRGGFVRRGTSRLYWADFSTQGILVGHATRFAIGIGGVIDAYSENPKFPLFAVTFSPLGIVADLILFPVELGFSVKPWLRYRKVRKAANGETVFVSGRDFDIIEKALF